MDAQKKKKEIRYNPHFTIFMNNYFVWVLSFLCKKYTETGPDELWADVTIDVMVLSTDFY